MPKSLCLTILVEALLLLPLGIGHTAYIINIGPVITQLVLLLLQPLEAGYLLIPLIGELLIEPSSTTLFFINLRSGQPVLLGMNPPSRKGWESVLSLPFLFYDNS